VRQQALAINPRLVYAPENFLLHAGVREEVARCMADLRQKDRLSVCFFSGASRSGKTHLAIKLLSLLEGEGFSPLLLEGPDFARWLLEEGANYEATARDVLILDQAEKYLGGLEEASSGPFVDIMERLRLAGAGAVFLSAVPLAELQLNPHVASRLRPGAGYTLDSPAEEDLPELMAGMLRQYGISLSERKISFLIKRLPRSIMCAVWTCSSGSPGNQPASRLLAIVSEMHLPA